MENAVRDWTTNIIFVKEMGAQLVIYINKRVRVSFFGERDSN